MINIILHDDFEGFEFGLRYGEGMEDGQAANDLLHALGGISSDRGNMTASLSCTNQDEMVQSEKGWAVAALYPLLTDGEWVPNPSGSLFDDRVEWDVSCVYAEQETTNETKN